MKKTAFSISALVVSMTLIGCSAPLPPRCEDTGFGLHPLNPTQITPEQTAQVNKEMEEEKLKKQNQLHGSNK